MTTEKQQDGPTLQQYIETRLNLLTEVRIEMATSMERRFQALDSAATIAAKGVDERFKHLEQLVKIGQDSAQLAVNKAESAQGAHNVAANEWRGTLNDFKTTLVGKSEFDKLYADFQSYRLEVARLFSAQSGEKSATKETRETQAPYIGLIGGVIGAVFGALVAVGLAVFNNNKAAPTPAAQVIVVPTPTPPAPK